MKLNIFCSKKGHQIYPLEIERIDENGNIFVCPCKECEEEISIRVGKDVEEYIDKHHHPHNQIEEICAECDEGENELSRIIDILEKNKHVDPEIIFDLSCVRQNFYNIEYLSS